MLSQTTLFALAALSTLTSAITVTNPNRQTIWDSGKSNTITWSKVSTDPSSFDIYLSHMVGGSAPLNALLFSDVSSDKGSVVVEGLQLPTGDAYQINFVAHNKPEQIYAQSNQFNVTGEAVKATSTVEGYTGPTYTSKASSGASASDDKTTAKDTTLVTSTTASGKATETSSTKTETDSSASSETTGTSGTAANAEATQTESGTASKASLSATATPNAAVGNVATGSLAAFVFGAIALFA